MPNKRSRRGKVNQFFCPYCSSRLWRNGSSKYHLFYRNTAEIQQNLGLTHKKATFLASQSSVYLDRDRWIEEFFCSQHSTVWLLISRQADGSLAQTIAKKEDWQKTTKTIHPNMSNPSVSEFSYCMSRSSSKQNRYYNQQTN